MVLEIIFVLAIVAILTTWALFIRLGFKANRNWGLGMIFLFPFSPFVFASRFVRKSRKLIYYYASSLLFLIGVHLYIVFGTVNFYADKAHKMASWLPEKETITSAFDFSSESEPEPENTEIEIELIENADINTKIDESPELVEKPPEPVIPKPKPKRSYKVVHIKDMRLYVGKNVIISTSRKRHKGVLSSIKSGRLEVRKKMAGGSTTMGISYSKILKVEVYL